MSYTHISICPTRIPKAGKKIFVLEDIELFLRPVKGLVFIYEASTGRQLLCVPEQNKNKALQLIHKRLPEVREMISCINSNGYS